MPARADRDAADAVDESGSARLRRAVIEGDVEFARQALTQGVDLAALDEEELTLLHHAAWKTSVNALAMVKLLLGAGNPNAPLPWAKATGRRS